MGKMMKWFCGLLLTGALFCQIGLLWAAEAPYKTKNVVIAVMDGVRWMDTFGDPTHQSIPHLYNDLRPLGTLFTNYYDRGITVTRQGHSTLISGTWQMIPNGGARLTRPTLFEYYRDEKGIPPTKAWSIFGKARYSFEPYSSYPAYGEKFAASHIDGSGKDNPVNEASAEGDVGVYNKVVEVMKRDQPSLMFINFGFTDHCGHMAKDISEYQAAIKNCEEQMWKLWNATQADPNYRDVTTVFFTNDHGRHTNDFHGHGDHCAECEHIMLLVVGPDIKANYVAEAEALQIDVAPTAAELLGIQTPLSTGRVLTECFTQCAGINKKQAVTDAARKALEMEKLADRDLIKAAADWALGNFKPETTPADVPGEMLALGMLRAYAEKQDQKYLDFAKAWLDAHKAQPSVAVGMVIFDLPQALRREYMPIARAAGDEVVGWSANPGNRDRATVLAAGALLGRLGKATKEAKYLDTGLKLVQGAIAPAGPQPIEGAKAGLELWSLAQAVMAYPEDKAIAKAAVIATFRACQGVKEEGGLWQDPTASVVNLAAFVAVQRTALLKEFGKRKKGAKGLPPVIEAMTAEEANKYFTGEKPAGPRRAIAGLISGKAKQGLPFSRDALRYGVRADGAYGDGSALAQGGFLVAYQKLPWRYDGNTWPGVGKVGVGTVDMGPKPAAKEEQKPQK